MDAAAAADGAEGADAAAGAAAPPEGDAASVIDESWVVSAERARNLIASEDAAAEAMRDTALEIATDRDEIAAALAQERADLEPLLAELSALGPAPESGIDGRADLRAELSARIEEAEARVGQLEVASARADTLIRELIAVERARFSARLTLLGPSPLHPGYWSEALSETISVIQRSIGETRARFRNPWLRAQMIDRAPLAGLALLVGLAILFVVRRYLGAAMASGGSRAGRRQRLLFGLGAAATQFFGPMAALVLILFAIEQVQIFGRLGAAIQSGLVSAAVYMIVAFALSSIYFSPNARSLRIAPATDAQARSGMRAVLGIAVALGLDRVLYGTAQALEAEASVLAVMNAVSVSVASVLLWRLLRALTPDARARGPGEDAPLSQTTTDRIGATLRMLGLGAAIIAPLLAAVGYLLASRYLIFPVILSSAVIGLFLIAQAVVREVFSALAQGDDAEKAVSPARSGAVTLISGAIFSLATIPLFALAWGADVSDLRLAWSTLAEGLTVGDVVISPVDFLTFAIVIGIGYFLVRLIKRLLAETVLPTAGLTPGAAATVQSAVGYVGFSIVGLVAVSSAGLDLSNIAIVAGALSVGIGFGLQNIVNNFVSGLILLIERPIKVGDWIDIGTQQGHVRKINVRATEIETFDRATYIVPNSDLISAGVLNLTHSNDSGRVTVPVGVAYAADPRRVEAILMEIARAHEMVMNWPAPVVLFREFGADSLNFEIRAFLRDVNYVLQVHSEMNFEIARRFREEGIEIPFAQRDLWVRNTDELAEALRGDRGT